MDVRTRRGRSKAGAGATRLTALPGSASPGTTLSWAAFTMRRLLVFAAEYWRCLVLYHHDGNYLVLSRPRDEPSSCARAAPFPNRTKRCIDYR